MLAATILNAPLAARLAATILNAAQVFEPNSAWTEQLQSQLLGNFRQSPETFRALPESPEKYLYLTGSFIHVEFVRDLMSYKASRSRK